MNDFTSVETIMLILIGMCLTGLPIVMAILVSTVRGRNVPATTADPEALRRIAADLAGLSAQVKAMAQPQEQAPAAQEGVPANA